MAKLILLILMALSLTTLAEEGKGDYWEGGTQYTEQYRQDLSKKVNDRLAYDCRQDIKATYVSLLSAKEQRTNLSVSLQLHRILISEYLKQKDVLDQDILFYQWKYQSMVTQCESESLINTKELSDLLTEIQGNTASQPAQPIQ